jgi:hypothetical protein
LSVLRKMPIGTFTGLSGAAQPTAWAIIPTPRQQGMDRKAASTETPRWSWARPRKRVFALEMATSPLCQRGALRIIVAITQEVVITRILRHLKLTAVLLPIAPARSRQAMSDWVA